MICIQTLDGNNGVCTGYGKAGWNAPTEGQKEAEIVAACEILDCEFHEVEVVFKQGLGGIDFE